MPGVPFEQACILTYLFRLHSNKAKYVVDLQALQSG